MIIVVGRLNTNLLINGGATVWIWWLCHEHHVDLICIYDGVDILLLGHEQL